jgi:uncharacterized protein (TIGR02145 family)
MKSLKFKTILIITVFSLGSCNKEPQKNPEIDYMEYSSDQGEIGQGGGLIKIVDENSDLKGTSIEIPENALINTNLIIITKGANSIPIDSNAVVVSFQPSGLQFQEYVKIGVPYSSEESNPELINIYYYDDSELSGYTKLEKASIDTENRIIYAYTSHFSTFIATGDNGVQCKISLINVNGKIAVRCQIMGSESSIGLASVPTTFVTQFNGHGINAWNTITDIGLEVFSCFRVILFEDKAKSGLANRSIWLYRSRGTISTYKTVVFDSAPEENSGIFISDYLKTTDINDNKDGLGHWLSGKPLIFTFDEVDIDPNKKYYATVIWGLSSQGRGGFVFSAQTTHAYTPIFKFNNRKDKIKLSEMPAYNDDKNRNYIDDSYEGNLTPVVAFTATPTTITAGQSVQFTDQSTNAPTSWSWNFGDGNTSTSKSPSHSYSSAGNYTVTLTATNGYGSDSKTKTNYITVNTAGSSPVAAFTATPTTITAGQSVQFTDQSTNAPTSWSWNFGDGNTSTSKSPSHSYSSAGNYTVTLTSANGYGSDSETKTNYITVTESGGGETGTFTDSRDNRTYKTVTIGNQTWMAENLAYLPSVVGPATESYTDPYHYVYGYNGTSVSDAKATDNYQTYGVLYNWTAALQACPTGWHLPTDAEWTELEDYLIANGYNYDGTTTGNKIAKALATSSGWSSYSGTGTVGNTDYPDKRNATGFSALPGGHRGYGGSFGNAGNYGGWWSATENSSSYAWDRYLFYSYGNVGRFNYFKEYGFSVRCLRDN